MAKMQWKIINLIINENGPSQISRKNRNRTDIYDVSKMFYIIRRRYTVEVKEVKQVTESAPGFTCMFVCCVFMLYHIIIQSVVRITDYRRMLSGSDVVLLNLTATCFATIGVRRKKHFNGYLCVCIVPQHIYVRVLLLGIRHVYLHSSILIANLMRIQLNGFGNRI